MNAVRSLLLGVSVLAAACGGSEPVGQAATADLDRDTYIDVLVELRVAARDAHEPAAFELRKQEILDRHGTTEEGLLRFTETRSTNVRYMAEIWDTIHARVEAALAASSADP